jgi:hypothetical protein
MRPGKFIYISVSYLNQLEPLLPEVRVIDFGIDNIGCPLLIRSILGYGSKYEFLN